MELRPDYPVRTARLLLRPLRTADTDDLVAYRSIPAVCRYVPFEPMDAAAVAERLAGPWANHAIAAAGEALTLGVERDGTLIGDVVLFTGPAEHRGGEIGWVVHPEHGGHGYATEAAHALLHLAFDDLGLHRVVARIDARNDDSLRLADRLGMRREALLVDNEWFKGDWSSGVEAALLHRDWAAQHVAGCPLRSP